MPKEHILSIMKFVVCFIIGIVFATSGYCQTPIDSLEAEDAVYDSSLTRIVAANGTVFLRMRQTGYIQFAINAPSRGTYSLTFRVRTSNGAKSQRLLVNGVFAMNVKFPAKGSFFDFNAGNVALQAGQNQISIVADWGYVDFDKLTVFDVPRLDYSQTTPSLINPNADQNTKDLYALMRSNFGKKIFGGNTAGTYGQATSISGLQPSVIAYDFLHYSNGYTCKWANNRCNFGWVDDGTTRSAINNYRNSNRKQIVTFQWHWYSPFGGQLGGNSFYSNATTFDVRQALIAGTPEHIGVLRDIDSVASQLKKLQRAGVPVLFRPLHEACGGWFWWGAQGPGPAIQLWDTLYDRITNYHQINNLIWVWSTPEPNCYPGNDKIDILGYDSYPSNFDYGTQKNIFDQLYAMTQGKKLLALTENGPIPDVQAMFDEDAIWSFFMTWNNYITDGNSADHVRDVFLDPRVVSIGTALSSENQSAPVAVAPKAEEHEVGVFPNPANGGDWIHLSNAKDISSVSVCDVLGKCETFETASFRTQLRGVLTIRVVQDGNEKVLKAVVY